MVLQVHPPPTADFFQQHLDQASFETTRQRTEPHFPESEDQKGLEGIIRGLERGLEGGERRSYDDGWLCGTFQFVRCPPPTSIASVKNDDILVEALLRLEDPQTLPRVLTKIQSGVRKVT